MTACQAWEGGKGAPSLLPKLVLPRQPVIQLGRWKPPDPLYFNRTVSASTVPILCFNERHSDWLKKFLSLPKLKNKHRVSHRYPSSASKVQPKRKLNHGCNFFHSFKFTSQVHTRHLHTQYLKLPVKKSFMLQKKSITNSYSLLFSSV